LSWGFHYVVVLWRGKDQNSEQIGGSAVKIVTAGTCGSVCSLGHSCAEIAARTWNHL
jgi:hypothetical protein